MLISRGLSVNMGNIIKGSSDDIIEITVRDYSGARQESRRCPAKDEASLDRIIKWLKEKYGTGTTTENEKSWLSLDSEFLKF